MDKKLKTLGFPQDSFKLAKKTPGFQPGEAYKLLPLLGIISILVIVFWPLLTGSILVANGISYSDVWTFNYPLKDWYRQQLLAGKMPFWTSLAGNGFPVFAEGQVGALYPLHLILFRLFPTTLAYNLDLFINSFVAFYLTYLFARISIKLSKPGAFLAGLTYSLSGYYWTQLQYLNVLIAIAWVPLAFLAIERLVSTKRLAWIFILALAFSQQILAGHPEYCLYTIIFGFVFFILINWLLVERKSVDKQSFIKPFLFFAALGLTVGLTAVQILSTFELSKQSNRGEGLSLDYVTSTSWPLSTLSLFVYPGGYEKLYQGDGEIYHPQAGNFVNPNAVYGYIGLIPIILCLIAIIFNRRRMTIVFTILLGLAFLYAQGRATQLFEILWQIVPGLQMVRFSIKALFFLEFCLTILAGIGFDYLINIINHRFKLNKNILVISGLIILFTLGDLLINNIGRFRKTMPIGDWLTTPESVKYLKTFLADGKFRYYTHGTNNLAYKTVDIPLHKQYQNIMPVNYNLLFDVASNRGYFTMLVNRQVGLEKIFMNFNNENESLTTTTEFKRALSLQASRYLLTDLPIDDKELVLLKKFPLPGQAEHYIFFKGTGDGQPTTKIVPTSDIYLYENKGAYPRVNFVSKTQIINNQNNILETILNPEFNPTEEVIIEDSSKQIADGSQLIADSSKRGVIDNNSTAKIIRDNENELEIEVKTDKSGFLVLADTYYPGWQATIDNQPTKIYRANYNFRAISVSPGRHTIIFSFKPTYWQIGLIISAVFLGLSISGIIFSLWKRK
ncbi:MAG: YfhO family protein [Candidatus Gottesmanbacteria bacterium]